MKAQTSEVKDQNHKSRLKTDRGSVSENNGFEYKTKKGNDGTTAKDMLKFRSYKFAVAVVKFIDKLENRSSQFSIRDQLIRAAISVGANIAEARSASSKRDFLKFYEIALKSSNETKFWLCLLRDAFDIDKSKIESLLNEAVEISNMLAASILTMKNKR